MVWTKDTPGTTIWTKIVDSVHSWDKQNTTGSWSNLAETSYLLNSSNGKLLTDQFSDIILVSTGNERGWTKESSPATSWQI